MKKKGNLGEISIKKPPSFLEIQFYEWKRRG
jgi:hypothetical protein